ncbi:uncharacterized protein LOC142324142 [Lycorma delicatula]|uniref:uncharacterized protein LOC142324142 n=1 Tax=Lycorma delicatula TaxID=130591 RepID=UPI003F5129AB
MEFVIKLAVLLILLKYVFGWYFCPTKCECISQSVDCSHRGLKELPIYFPPHVESLDLSGNELYYLSDILHDLQSLAHLNLGWNQLHHIPDTSLQNLLKLKTLNLSGNKFHRLSDIQGIHYSNNLIELYLQNNPIYEIGSCSSDDTLYSESLNKLDLSKCVITNIDRCAFKWLTNLTHLYLSGNPLQQLTKIVSNSIQHLDVTNCDIQYIIAQAFDELPELKYLDLSQNSNLKVHTPFDNRYMSVSLIHLDATNCDMTELILSKFPNLKYSSFKGNFIRELPPRLLYQNQQLIKLDLSENLISSINYATFIGGESLINLDLSSNFIQDFNPGTFSGLFRLTKLKLSKNPLKWIPNISSVSLQYLDVSDCEIAEISYSISYNIPQIRTLNLSNNPIEFLSNEIHLDYLTELDLSYCRITMISIKAFKNLPTLKKLDIRGNRLTNVFNHLMMDYMINIKEIIVTNNPWQCGCNTTNHEEFLRFVIARSPSENEQDLTCLIPDSQLEISWTKSCQLSLEKNDKKYKSERHWTAFLLIFAVMSSLVLVMLVLRHNLALTGDRPQDNNDNVEPHTTPYPVRSPIADILQLPTYEEAILLPKPTVLSLNDSRREVATCTSNQSLNNENHESNNIDCDDEDIRSDMEDCSLCHYHDNLNVSSTSL